MDADSFVGPDALQFMVAKFYSKRVMAVTPSMGIYKPKTFLQKVQHVGYDENNLTEDLEIALRIQSKDYVLENAPEAVVYTLAPKNFKELLYQNPYCNPVRLLFREELKQDQSQNMVIG